MTRHTWIHHIGAPLVLAGMIGIVWSALANRPQPIISGPQSASASATPIHTSSSTSIQSNQQPIADIAPTVNELGSTLEFSLDSKPWKQIQKVEFYVETKLVGAVFAPPYAVRLNENALTAGTHTVTAKVYTPSSTAQTTPTLFTAKSATPQSADSDHEPVPVVPAVKPQAPQALPAPAGLAIVAADDGTTAQLSWNSVNGATSYQVWRDGSNVGTVAAPGYTDTGLNPGQTYDYAIVAVSTNGTNSDLSTPVAVTMPVPQPSGQDPVNVPPTPPTPPPAPVSGGGPDDNSNPTTPANSDSDSPQSEDPPL